MTTKINNQFYDDLHDQWYDRNDHPIGLLRQENLARNPWIKNQLSIYFKKENISVLDIGCGGGFLTNFLASSYQVTGIDLSKESLAIAKKQDPTQSVQYLFADATDLPFKNESFEAVFAMDLLEHVEEPERVIQEASRVLKPKGLFFYHTFNRNVLSYLLIIKGVEWFVPHAPANMHIYPLFIKPSELTAFLNNAGLKDQVRKGLSPNIWSKGTLDLLFKKEVSNRFRFKVTSNLTTGYMGFAKKE
jgi:2-polyprenyl-6-hydroxyphenyl methylase/3-demethylubiquinone-9 3-methyltransferase